MFVEPVEAARSRRELSDDEDESAIAQHPVRRDRRGIAGTDALSDGLVNVSVNGSSNRDRRPQLLAPGVERVDPLLNHEPQENPDRSQRQHPSEGLQLRSLAVRDRTGAGH